MSEHDKVPMCVIQIPVDCINRDLCERCNLSIEELIMSQLRPMLDLGDPASLGQGNVVAENQIIITLG